MDLAVGKSTRRRKSPIKASLRAIGMAFGDIQLHQRQQRFGIVRGESRRTFIRRAGLVELSLRLTQPPFCHDGGSTIFRCGAETLQCAFGFNPVLRDKVDHHQHVERGHIIRPLFQQVIESRASLLVMAALTL